MVILCYHADDVVESLVRQIERELDAAQVDYELVLVGNYHPGGASEQTPVLLRKLADGKPRIRVLAKAKEGMMGWDMRSGMEAARGRNIAVIDGDGQMPMSDIMRVYRVLQTGGYDLVKTFRAKRWDGWRRRCLSNTYNFLFRLLYPAARVLRDMNAKPKVMTRAAYEKMNLVSNGWFTDAEIMIEALKHNLTIAEISTVFYKNERRDTFVPFSAVYEFLWNMIYYRFFKND